MIRFIKSCSMKVKVLKEQEKFLSAKDRIEEAINLDNVIAFDIFDDNILIGFALLKEFDNGCFFLWDFAIDYKYQNKGYGTKLHCEGIRENGICPIHRKSFITDKVLGKV